MTKLFVNGHRMHPTSCITARRRSFPDWLENIRGQLNPPEFDPATIQQGINIIQTSGAVGCQPIGFLAAAGTELASAFASGADGATEQAFAQGADRHGDHRQ